MMNLITSLMAKGLIAAIGLGSPAGHNVTIPENYNYEFNLNAGDQLNLILDPIALDGMTPQQRCEDDGGRFRVDEYTTLMICDDVDF